MKKSDTDVAGQVTVEQVVEEMRVASINDIMSLPALRRAKAVPFQIPGTDFVVKIAASTQLDIYKNIVYSMNAVNVVDNDEQIEAMKRTANSIIKSCVVEPELTDEAIEALNEYSSVGINALIEKCQQISGLGGLDTKSMEDFS